MCSCGSDCSDLSSWIPWLKFFAPGLAFALSSWESVHEDVATLKRCCGRNGLGVTRALSISSMATFSSSWQHVRQDVRNIEDIEGKNGKHTKQKAKR
jgi:hypothetical protein